MAFQNDIPERPLTAAERELLLFVLAHAGGDAAKYLPLVDGAIVNGACKCGCPTVDLKSPEADVDLREDTNPLVDLVGKTSTGMDVGLLVFASKRQLTMLEVYRFGGNEGAFGLPTIESLTHFSGEPLQKKPNA